MQTFIFISIQQSRKENSKANSSVKKINRKNLATREIICRNHSNDINMTLESTEIKRLATKSLRIKAETVKNPIARSPQSLRSRKPGIKKSDGKNRT